ncbi:MAG: peptidoglycan-binding protein [Myxococcota bacterium]
MNAEQELALLESDEDRLRLANPADVAGPLAALLAIDGVLGRRVQLTTWARSWPRATAQLVACVTGSTVDEIVPTLLGWDYAPTELRAGIDELLISAFPRLEGAYREAAAERPFVRAHHRLVVGRDYTPLQPVDPSWLWPSGRPFPGAESWSGVQARLNWLGYGSGPINGVADDRTRRALARWQLHACLAPTGEIDEETAQVLAWDTPEAP